MYGRFRLVVGAVVLALLASVLGGTTAAAATGSPTVLNGPGRSAPSPRTPATPPGLRTIDNGFGPSAAQSTAMKAAADQAHRTGKPVAVDTLTTETDQVVAQPDGRFTVAATPQPTRTSQHGTWVPIDTTLRRDQDGTWSPAATAYGSLTLSGGGPGPLAVTRSGETSYAVSWPGPLPTPTVAGPTATYTDVLPGVDLALTATSTGGFSDVLLIHTAQAAHNPALATLTLPTTVHNGHVLATGGALRLAATGGRVLTGSTPLMWDSNTATPGNSRPGTGAIASAEPSNAGHAGTAAHVAAVGMRATDTALRLVPDAGLLTGSATMFPLFVDPTFNWSDAKNNTPSFDEVKQGAPCNHVSYYNDAGSDADNGLLGVGVNIWQSCFGIMRAYYQWSLPSVLSGATINLATVNALDEYSGACGPANVNLHVTGAIGPGTSWNDQPAYGGSYTSTRFPAAENPGHCPNNGLTSGGFTVTGAVAQLVGVHASLFTVALAEDAAEAAHDSSGFARFSDNPTLEVTYNHAPIAPANLTAVTGSDNAGCGASPPYAYIGRTIQSNAPVLDATLNDPDNNPMQATFFYKVDGAADYSSGLSQDGIGSGGTAKFSIPWSFISGLGNGQTVDWYVTATDGQASSPPSQTCHFIAEPDPPLKPVVTSADGKFPNSLTNPTAETASGVSGRFAITNSDLDVTNYVWGLDQPPPTTNPSPGSVLSRQPNGLAAANPADRWQFTGPISQTGVTAADSAGTHPLTLGGGATMLPDPRTGPELAMLGNGYAASSTPVINTTSSFSVSAWVKLRSPLTDAEEVVQQSGSVAGDMFLQYSPTFGGWAFIFKNQNDTTEGVSQYTYVSAPATAPSSWTHLVGVYDTTGGADVMTLYVNGIAAGSKTVPTPWSATGPFSVGATVTPNGTYSYTNGYIADVQTYSRALTQTEVASIADTSFLSLTPLWPGQHHLYVYAQDAAGDLSETYDYPFLAKYDNSPVQNNSLAAAYNSIAITPANPNSPGGADGVNSYSSQDLINAGWTPGGKVTVDGATFTLPSFGADNVDNVLAAGQIITSNDPVLSAYDANVPTSGASSLMFLAAATNTPTESPGLINGDATAPFVPPADEVASTYCFKQTDPNAMCVPNGWINYGSAARSSYDLAVPDWITGPAALAAVVLPHENTPSGQSSAVNPRIYAFSVPLTPGTTITSVQLPDVSLQNGGGTQALHIFAMAIRNTTVDTPEANGGTTAIAGASQPWTGAWASPTEGAYNFQSGTAYGNQTFRVLVKPSIAGTGMRIKLDNALGTVPLTIGAVTVAEGTATPSASLPSGTAVTPLSFGKQAGVTIPAGGMAYSDPLAFAVDPSRYLVVSFEVTSSVAFLPEHYLAGASLEYVTAPGAGDATSDLTGTPYTRQGQMSDVLTDVDVTGAGTAGTLAVLGDNLTDPLQSGAKPDPAGQRLSDDIAGAVTTGVVGEGIEANQIVADNPESYAGGTAGGPAVLSRIDRDILDQPNLSAVVIDEGLSDVLAARTSPPGVSLNSLETGFSALLGYLDAYNINITEIGATPCDGYAGDGAATNDPCTPGIDAIRTALNSAGNLAGAASFRYVDPDAALGVTDTNNGEQKLNPNADTGDHANLTDAGDGALASAFLRPLSNWPLDDGDGTDAVDHVGSNDATLTGGAGWASDPSRGEVLQLDGGTGHADTVVSAVNTAAAFSVSAWADLTATGHDGDVASQDGPQNSGFELKYDSADNRWAFSIGGTGTAVTTALSTAAPATNAWTHLVGTYNPATHALALYVNGVLAGTATANDSTGLAAANGAFAIGRGLLNAADTNYFAGELSAVQVWNYVLTAPQALAAALQI